MYENLIAANGEGWMIYYCTSHCAIQENIWCSDACNNVLKHVQSYFALHSSGKSYIKHVRSY